MRKLKMEAGIETLCTAVLKQAASDYFSYRRALENPKTNEKKKIEARINLDDLIDSFTTGHMDLYTMILDHMDGMDVLEQIITAYEMKNKHASADKALKAVC